MLVVLITGCSSGFGELTAIEFAKTGARVFASMRNPSAISDRLLTLADENPLFEVIPLDVCDRISVDAAVQHVLNQVGRIDVLINNAGIVLTDFVDDMPEDHFRQIMETNFFGPLLLTKAVLPTMVKQKFGVIVMLSSLSAMLGLSSDAAYSASKAALEKLAECLYCEHQKDGIQLKVIRPGAFNTALAANSIKNMVNQNGLVIELDVTKQPSFSSGDAPLFVAKEIVEIVKNKSPILFYSLGKQAQDIEIKVDETKQQERHLLLNEMCG
ncbi:MAG: SDR family NAD(P)-dependent oxidoreductase [Arenicella sp.]|nr:SDR family NAD(P)-dependent oxidoreductase [Arenicella sp.]